MKNGHAFWGSLLIVCLTASGLRAEHQPETVKAEDSTIDAEHATKMPSMWEQDYLTGDWGGARTKLSDKGVAFGVNLIDEVLGNPTGGIDQAVINGGRVELTLDLDFEKMAGLQGSSFHSNAYYIYGSDLSAGHIGNIFTVSNIEAYDTLRLFDLWYQQEFKVGSSGKISIRAGQIAADDEFFISDYAATFINGTFGWPALTAANLPSGGPGYPLATPGIRLQYDPIEDVSLLAAVFDGDPGDRGENPQKKDSTGTNIDFNQGFFSMFEAQYRVKLGQQQLPGQYKLGAFYATQNFPDVGTDDQGFSLADTANTTGNPRAHSGDWGVYFIADQMVWRENSIKAGDPKEKKDAKDMKNAKAEEPDDQGLGVFWRVGGAPQDVNLISFYTDAGVNYKGLITGRDNDVAGLAVAYGHISDDVSQFDRDNNTFNDAEAPVRNEEIAIEFTYQAQIAPWWVVQPDIQYIIHPGGNSPDPDNGNHAIDDALVLGVRTTISF